MADIIGFFIALFFLLGIPVGIVVLIVSVVKNENARARKLYEEKQAALAQQQGSLGYIPDGEEQENQTVYDYQDDPQPYKVSTVPAVPKEPLSASAIMMLIGTAFIILSAITFVAANWVKMEPAGRVLALLGEAVLAFIISCVMKKLMKLEGTSIAFYTIGSVVAAVSMVTACGYELFGEWFSVGGDGMGLVFATASAIVTAASFIGYSIYKKSLFHYFGFSFTSIVFVFLCVQLTNDFEQFAPLIVLVQMVITASLHILKPHKGTVAERSAAVIGDIASVVYDCIGLSYVFSVTDDPTPYSFTVLGVILAQLLFYGFYKKQNWMFIIFNLLSGYTALTTCYLLNETHSEGFTAVFFAIITLMIYLVNLIIPNNHVAAKIISFAGAIFGAIISLCVPCDVYDLANMAVPLIVSVIITLYAFHKNEGIQTAAGIAAPALPFFTFLYFRSRLGNLYPEIRSIDMDTLVYGGFVALLLAAAALFIFLPKIAFNIHARHPRKSEAVLFSNLIVSAAVLVCVSGRYSELFFITLLLCIVHFVISCMVSCNATAIGSVVAVIFLTSNILNKLLSDNGTAVVYLMFTLFLILIAVSHFVFRMDLVYKKDGKTSVDVILLSAWIMVFTMTGEGRTSAFLILISTAVFIAGFIKKNTKGDTASILLSVSAFFAAMAALARPFLNPDSSMINSKITLGIFVLLGVAYKYIWRNHKEASKTVSTIIFVLSFAGLIFDGIIYDDVINRIFVLAVTAAILILSFYTKSKTWFIASSIALVIITVLSTKEFFDTLGWWVYLFVVGVVLVAIAAVNEACKKKGETMKSTVEKKFSDWTWV